MRAWRGRKLRRQFLERSQTELSGVHDLQPALVRERQVRSYTWGRADQQSRTLLGVVAADQRRDGRFGHALLLRARPTSPRIPAIRIRPGMCPGRSTGCRANTLRFDGSTTTARRMCLISLAPEA